MSKQIKSFLESLKNWKDNFEFRDFQITEGDELSQIVFMQRGKDIEGLLKVWLKKLEHDCFELPHPENKKIKTRAVHSVRYGMGNYVFMNDSTGTHPWVFCQCVNFIDVIITEGCIYKASLFDGHAIEPFIHYLSEISVDKLRYGFNHFALWVSQKRPYHFFYDQLKFFLFFDKEKDVCFRESFFSFERNENNVLGEAVLLFPTVVGGNYQKTGMAKILNEEMENAVYDDATKGFLAPECSREVLKLWYGVTGQKRSWLQQVDGIYKIVKHLSHHFSKIELYVDGITAEEGQVIHNAEDEEVFSKILNRLDSECEVRSVIGKDYRSKIKVSSAVDVFIANAGTGCMVPLRFCKKPGVLHSNTKLFTFPDDYPDTVKECDEKYVIDVFEEGKRRPDFASYHIPWQHIFNLTAEVLNKTKGTNIKPLDVPPVEDVAKHYDKQQKAYRQKLMAFKAVENRVKPEHKSPDILREVALSFEHAGDIETALKIMQKSLELRPTGPFIKKKVLEYQKVLGKNEEGKKG